MQQMVQLGHVLAGAVPFSENNINDTFRGLVSVNGQEKPAIIKDLWVKELANEVLVAAVALMIGLPVPQPVLALATPDRLKVRKGPQVNGGRLVYASVDVAQPQVAMLLRVGVGRRVLDRLAEWSDLGRLYGFDALVANIDRHEGNILFSGNKEVWIIDHGHCFTGPSWVEGDLYPPDQTTTSRLQEWMTPNLNLRERNSKSMEAASIETDANRLSLSQIASDNYLGALLSEDDLSAVLEFLDKRKAHVPRLAAAALEVERLL